MRIKVNGLYYDYFDAFSIQTTLDRTASTFAFSALYNPDSAVHRALFKPLSYNTVSFYDDLPDERLLSTCTVLNLNADAQKERTLVQVSGYSKSGIIEDCQIPYSAYPLESNNLSLKQIAEKYCSLLGVKVVIHESVQSICDEKIVKTVARPEQTIKDYLSKIAAQKNVVISHDIYGNLYLFRPRLKEPSLQLNEENTISLRLNIAGQGIHSDLTSIRQPQKSDDGEDPFTNSYTNLPEFGAPAKSFKVQSVDTVKNPLVGLFRPSVDVLSSGTFYNTTTAARNRRSSELLNIQIEFSLNYWPKVSVGDVIEVISPEIFLFSKTKLILHSTTISQSANSKTMTGTLVLPEAFTGDEPKNIFG